MKVTALLLALVCLVSCSSKGTHVKHSMDSTYLVFEFDSISHKVAIGWSIIATLDSTQTDDNDNAKPHRYRNYFVNWALPITDSLKHTLKRKDGQDSTRMAWLQLDSSAILLNLGRKRAKVPIIGIVN